MGQSLKKFLFLLTAFLFSQPTLLFSQKMTSVKGVVTDAETKETLPFVNVAFIGTTAGTTTDLDGSYSISTRWASDSLKVSFVGYEDAIVLVKTGSNQKIDVVLHPTAVNLGVVEINAKKGGYKRKGNPAVALIKKVIGHKGKNRMEGQDYYEYEKYEKIELDLNNITDGFKKKKAFKKFQFIFEYVDTSELNGKPYLPVFIRETASKVYYRKNPKAQKEYRQGIKLTGIDEYFDSDNLATLTDILYQEVDIYDNNVTMLGYQFMSPLSPLANTFYRFYILDTVQYKGNEVIDLAFMPASPQDIGFKGSLYVKNDSTYAVVKADFGISEKINLNFVQDLNLVQEFTHENDIWILSKDQIVVDIAFSKGGTGFFGTRSVLYRNHVFNTKRKPSIYSGTEKIIKEKNADKRDAGFWAYARQEKLTKTEEGVYHMIDTLQHVPAFRRTLDIITLLLSGYKSFGKVEIGPVGAFYSFNSVEGFRLRFGGATTVKFNPKLKLEGYAAYGFKDQEWKYSGAVLYSFQEDFKSNPKHFARISHQHETSFVGQRLDFVVEDNFFLSFKRGGSDKMLFYDSYKAEYFLETKSKFSWGLTYENKKQRPLGSLRFDFLDPENPTPVSLSELTTSEISTLVRFAPNEQFIQGKSFRRPLFNKYPVFTLKYAQGIKGFAGGDYDYQRLSLGIFKRFYFSVFGITDMEVEGGKIFGSGVPYFLLDLPRANQTFAFQKRAYNLMNFLEFANDSYINWRAEHNFNGFIFNRIPLFKKLKLREVLTVKGVWGKLSDKNNPLKNPGLIQFIDDDKGEQQTFTLEKKPYIEVSGGIKNIFKFGRIDVVKRLTYLDNPNMPVLFGVKGMGIRAMVKFEF
ncbi:MAG TPA: carboxypeptidase-like regulatory domain-containing protein [Bacteroidetes bacterium]|nr:carboxypeptidase-like regulatory domain-containing protein [Bacteroidota bacterium]